MTDHQNERTALTTADMLAALGWTQGTDSLGKDIARESGSWRVGFNRGEIHGWIINGESTRVVFGFFDAAVKSAYDAAFPADPDRVETSPVDLLRAENARLKAELAAIHKAMRDGADDALWPPGSTVAEAVARLVRMHDAVSYALQEQA
jgi:hypothetical protein